MTDPLLNIENLTLLRDTIAKIEATRFTMNYWRTRVEVGGAVAPRDLVHDCKTAGCIGGWTEVLFAPEDTTVEALPHYFARETLGLTDEQAENLFFPGVNSDWNLDYSEITQAEAIITLDKLIETGEVDWSHSEAQRDV